VSASPLELIYTDVRGPAITSVGGFKYYVSFIDDFSKFSWSISFMPNLKLRILFSNFRNMLNSFLIIKLRGSNPIGEGNIVVFTNILIPLEFLILFHVLTPINKMDLSNKNIDTS
jgi:hypothetical protein